MDPLDPELVDRLLDPAAYPDDASAYDGVEQVQTHLSHVFLTGERVYKLRKAVDLGFVDFQTRAARDVDCLREVALNRRLAPDVYLGVAPIRLHGERPRVGPVGEVTAAGAWEHCVVMRRLPVGRDALSLLERRALRPGQIDTIAARIARFHARSGLGAPAPFSPEQWMQRIARPALDNYADLRACESRILAAGVLARAERLSRDFLGAHGSRFEARRRAGRAVDGHGDLHLQHVWFETDDAPPLIIDCLEFSEALRQGDAAADVAFLAMDLRYRRRARWAERLLRVYAQETDDFDLYHVVDFFTSYRAAVRAKVAAVAAGDSDIAAPQRAAAAKSARQHLHLAARALEPRRDAALVLTCGFVGTGKSSVAALLADELGGVAIGSDRVRKRLAGLPPGTHAPADWQSGLYTPERVAAVYDALLERATAVVASGRPAVLDATFSRRTFRDNARRWAAKYACPALLVEVICEPSEVLDRLERRQAAGKDASDAGPELYAPSARGFEPLDDWPGDERFVIRTDHPGWRGEAREVAQQIRSRLKTSGLA